MEAHHSVRSSRQNILMVWAPPRLPERPILCTRLEQVYGVSTWTTASKEPTSIPSSRVTVETVTVFLFLSFRLSSAAFLRSLDMLP